MARDCGRDDAEPALEAAAAGRLHEVEERIDAVLREQSVVDLVVRDAGGGRSIDRLEGPAEVVRDDFSHGVDATRADDVEEAGGELGERGADAAPRDDGGAPAAEKARE